MARVKINILTQTNEPIAIYFAPSVPREGEKIVIDDKLLEVDQLIWEDPEENPEVQVRCEVIHEWPKN